MTLQILLKQAGSTWLLVFLLAACAGPAPAANAPAPAAARTASPAAAQSTPAPALAPASAGDALAACQVPAALTPPVTEGPYFKANSPLRSSLLQTGLGGMSLTLTGYVLNASCQPVANALLDFWQADSQGVYDNSGYTLRGHQFTDAGGRFQLLTVVPGLYPGRTEHIHVKVQAPNGPVLTTQLFFPGVQNNQADGIYNPALLITVEKAGAAAMQASFTFIIQ